MSLIFRYPERPALAVPLARLAREELAHFEEVITVLRAAAANTAASPPAPTPPAS
jgi:tRNA isopentenyl-2-thiomethyl-A-37 hydroxylase MiaE